MKIGKEVLHTSYGLDEDGHTDHDRRVFDRHNAGHHVHYPLWINDDMLSQEVIVKVLDSSEVMQELNSTFDLKHTTLM